MLARETLDEIATLVRTGFHDKDSLREFVCEEMYAPGELDPAEVSAALAKEFAQWEAEKGTWPAVTDCDRLDSVFVALNERGVLALQNAGYTQSDGYEEFRESYENHPDPSSVVGYCYYHGQDLEQAVRGGGLFLAFGPVDPSQEESGGREVGAIVREELERVGLSVEWDGSFAKRIYLPNLKWQRR